MTAIDRTAQSRTGLYLGVDTHIIDAAAPETVFLRKLHHEGWLTLWRADAMDTELATAPLEKIESLTETSGHFPEKLGPGIWGQSRWDHALWSGPIDGTQFDMVFAVLFPNADRNTARANHIKDTMHVLTAIRHGCPAFVTQEKRLLNKSSSIAYSFNGFEIWSPAQALAAARPLVDAAIKDDQAIASHELLYDWQPASGEWP